mmetsp:Transcript_24170/g.33382  ORF Transcript_24170/g.33382 Transcript_24170/m.33382 type:complete len:235 (-) Transcript_24170:131-835(-)
MKKCNRKRRRRRRTSPSRPSSRGNSNSTSAAAARPGGGGLRPLLRPHCPDHLPQHAQLLGPELGRQARPGARGVTQLAHRGPRLRRVLPVAGGLRPQRPGQERAAPVLVARGHRLGRRLHHPGATLCGKLFVRQKQQAQGFHHVIFVKAPIPLEGDLAQRPEQPGLLDQLQPRGVDGPGLRRLCSKVGKAGQDVVIIGVVLLNKAIVLQKVVIALLPIADENLFTLLKVIPSEN